MQSVIAENRKIKIHGTEQVTHALTQMQQMTQTTAASAEQSAAAGEELSSQAESLKITVRNLAALVGKSGD